MTRCHTTSGCSICYFFIGGSFLGVGVVVDAARHAIAEMTGLQTQLSTSGGTSDGRFIAPICPQVIELGPPNASIHKVDEHIALADMAPLSAIYRRILELLENCPER